MGEFEKQIWKLSEHYNKILRGKPISMSAVHLHVENILIKQKQMIEEAKKEFPFSSWLEEDLEELKMTIKRSVKERGHSVLDDEVSEEFIKTLDAIVKWFGTK